MLQIQRPNNKVWGDHDWECDITPEELLAIRGRARTWIKALADADVKSGSFPIDLGRTCYQWWLEGLAEPELALIRKLEAGMANLPAFMTGQAMVWAPLRFREPGDGPWTYDDGVDHWGQPVKAPRPRTTASPASIQARLEKKVELRLRDAGFKIE